MIGRQGAFTLHSPDPLAPPPPFRLWKGSRPSRLSQTSQAGFTSIDNLIRLCRVPQLLTQVSPSSWLPIPVVGRAISPALFQDVESLQSFEG